MQSWNFEADNPVWVYPKDNPKKVDSIVKEFRIHPVVARVLINRRFASHEEIHKYLYSKLPDLHDPFLLSQMDVAVRRIVDAIDREETIMVYGDNDVDGMTGTTLLKEFLERVGAKVFYYVSKPGMARTKMLIEALDDIKQHHCTLAITVDCGITAVKEIATMKEHGVDVIVTDHHEPTEELPVCVAILNPKLPGNEYPDRGLTGVGVAFKLAHGVTNVLTKEKKLGKNRVDLKRYLDLVALGTIADMGPLKGENRILVRYGLQQIKAGKRVGLAKLTSVSDIEPGALTTFLVAAKIAPRMNSLGRIDDPRKGVALLLVKDPKAGERMAEELDLNNIERQRVERTMASDVDKMTMEKPEILQKKAIVMSSKKWHPGIIAIFSARITKYFNRPTAMISIENGIGKGSLRSTHEFPLLPVLKECSDLLLNYGGHDFAAGLSLKEENIPEFTERFIAAADRQLSDQDVETKLYLDSELPFKDLTFDFMESIKLIEPFGNENPQPIFYTKAKQAWPPKVIGKTHLKLYLQQGERMLEGIAFGKAHLAPLFRKKNLQLEVAFTPQINTFQGLSIQLLVKDFRIVEG